MTTADVLSQSSVSRSLAVFASGVLQFIQEGRLKSGHVSISAASIVSTKKINSINMLVIVRTLGVPKDIFIMGSQRSD